MEEAAEEPQILPRDLPRATLYYYRKDKREP